MNSSSTSATPSTPSSVSTSIDSSEVFTETTVENPLKFSSNDSKPSYFFNYRHSLIQDTLEKVLSAEKGKTLNSQVQTLFRWVRDEIKYRVTFEISTREFLQAHYNVDMATVLQKPYCLDP
ncbi:MAG: hypothetical protein ACTSRK_18500 [Promethearchaeota archaeon]